LELARFDNILAIKTDRGDVVGFHSRNLQVAHLDEMVWQALRNKDAGSAEVADEIERWNTERDPAAHDADIPQAIRSFTINIAQICNLNCSYCAAGGDGTYGSAVKSIELSGLYEQIRMLMHDVGEGERFTFTFLGGEPLLYPETISAVARFARLQAAGRNIRLYFDIVTNGTLITPEIAELLASLRCNVTISLDGPPEINDAARPSRGGQGSSERILRGLGNLVKVRPRLDSLSVGSVFGPHNTNVAATYEYLRQFDFDMYKFDFAAGEGDSEASLAYAEAIVMTAELAWKYGGERELRKITVFENLFRTLDGKARVLSHCGAGKSLLQVDTSGKLYTCQWFVGQADEQVGEGLRVDHEKLQAYADPLIESNGCSACWARHLCGGGCMFVHKTKTGSKNQPDPDYCSRTKRIFAKGIEIYAQARHQELEGVGSEVH
jgi:uncharacterized protein